MNKINIISSFATDRIVYVKEKKVEVMEGGPALWISRALEDMGCTFRMYTGKKKAKVNIVIKDGDEKGEIISVSKVEASIFKKTDLSLISTIGDEFDLKHILSFSGLVALDLQGYIRTNNSAVGKFVIPQEILEKISILKITSAEAILVAKTTLDDQKNRILLVTRGKRGFIVYAYGKKYVYNTKPIKTVDAVGAGDTFFTAFSVAYREDNDVQKASLFAKEYVEKFLIEKDLQHTGIKDQLSGSITCVEDAKQSNKKVLLMVYVHGNEPIGYEVIKLLKKNEKISNTFDWIIANPPAVLQSKRYIDLDLNRVAPGKPHSREYESRRAYELMDILSNYTYVIDIHQTRANSRALIILPRVSDLLLEFINHIQIRNVLFWPLSPDSKNGSLVSFLLRGIGLEIGTKAGYKQAINKTSRILTSFLNTINATKTIPLPVGLLQKKNFFHVYGEIQPEDIDGQRLKDFNLVHGTKDEFIALLFGRHKKKLGYKMHCVDIEHIM